MNDEIDNKLLSGLKYAGVFILGGAVGIAMSYFGVVVYGFDYLIRMKVFG